MQQCEVERFKGLNKISCLPQVFHLLASCHSKRIPVERKLKILNTEYNEQMKTTKKLTENALKQVSKFLVDFFRVTTNILKEILV